MRLRLTTRLAAGVVIVFASAGYFAPRLAPFPRDLIQLEQGGRPPSASHLFGTDMLGRDVLSRILHGGRVSLAVATVATLVAVAIGTLLGALAGYLGGRVDTVISALVDTALSLPLFFLVLLLGQRWGASLGTLCIVVGLASWMPVARLVRQTTAGLRHRAFVEAARGFGFGTARVLARHVLPSTAAPILVASALGAAQAVLMESALGFLGFGLQPPTPSWGGMLHEAQSHLHDAPWLAVFPGTCIFLLVLALHALADAGQNALDPRARGERTVRG
jgi:peptide/nickel transport system permease protein